MKQAAGAIVDNLEVAHFDGETWRKAIPMTRNTMEPKNTTIARQYRALGRVVAHFAIGTAATCRLKR